MSNYIPCLNLQIIKSKFGTKLNKFFNNIQKIFNDVLFDLDNKINDSTKLKEIGIESLITYKMKN